MPNINPFCFSCGHIIKYNTGLVNPKDIPIRSYFNGDEIFFCNDKCKNRFDRTQARMNKVREYIKKHKEKELFK